jgi:hypothetical protein
MAKVGKIAESLSQWYNRSWEEVLHPSERLGGPTPWGSSRWGAFKKCPFYYYWLYVRKMEPVEKSEALEIGGLYHEVRARYYQAYHEGRSDDEAIQEGYDLLNRTEKVVPAYAATVRRLFKGWLTHSGPGTPNDDRHLLPEGGGIEEPIEYYEGPFPYSTRIDFWCFSSDGEGAILKEIKTASRRTGRLLASYKMDSQFLGQMYLWRKVMEPRGYPPLTKYIIDLAVKTNPPQFSREIAPVDNRTLSNWEHEMTQHWYQLRYFERSPKPWPRRRTYETCHYCELFDVCASNGANTTGWKRKNGKTNV